MVWFHPTDDMQAGSNANQLRPEVLESFFYMWRFTGDVMYQRWAWQIFLAFEKYSKVESGYAGLEVRQCQPFCCALCSEQDAAGTPK
jgi:mannosyl-oligosaccharide alpha-1,2-mannosidase